MVCAVITCKIMKTKKIKQPIINMEGIHRDYNFLCEFIHTQETYKDGLTHYSQDLFSRLEATIWDHLDKEDQTAFDTNIKALTALIETGLNSLEYYAKQALKSK